MSFLPPEQLKELCHFATISDAEVRSDLAGGFIKDENDYTSNFTGALRRNINTYSLSGLSATSFLLQHSEERECGGDATIILTHGSESKIAILEAKWPRFATVGYSWDYEQTATGLSHFSDQLARQARWHGRFAVFEMFYNELPLGEQKPPLNSYGSSCVWHEDADEFKMNRRNSDAVWTQDELKTLLKGKQITIADVMKEFGICTKGKPIQMAQPRAIGEEFRLPRQLLAIRAAGEGNAQGKKI